MLKKCFNVLENFWCARKNDLVYGVQSENEETWIRDTFINSFELNGKKQF